MKRRSKLKEMQICIPVHPYTTRSKEYDALALETANKLSATRIKRVKFEGKVSSAFSTSMDQLVYSCKGTPSKWPQFS